MPEQLEQGQRWTAPGVEVVISDTFVKDAATKHIGHFTQHPAKAGRRGVVTLDELVARGFQPAAA